MKVTTWKKKISIEILQTDWSQKIDGVPDTLTVAGRCFEHYGTLKGMPGGNLYRVDVPLAGLCVKAGDEDEGKALTLECASEPAWFEKLDATFGPLGKKSGVFEPIDPPSKNSTTRKSSTTKRAKTQSDELKLNDVALEFESVGAKMAFLHGIGHGEGPATAAGAPGGSSSLCGSTVVFSGLEPGQERELKKSIESFGGRVTSGVSGKTSHLVRGPHAGATKLAKAKHLNQTKNAGIRVVTYEEFKDLACSNGKEVSASASEPAAKRQKTVPLSHAGLEASFH